MAFRTAAYPVGGRDASVINYCKMTKNYTHKHKDFLIAILLFLAAGLSAQNYELVAPSGQSGYQWYQLGSGAISGATTDTLNVSSPGIYYADYTPAGETGCKQLTDYFILLANDISMGDTAVFLNATTVATGSYQWYKDDAAISGAMAGIYEVNEEGFYYAKIEPMDCSDTVVSERFIVRVLATEICGNGLDDNGDGVIDETCPALSQNHCVSTEGSVSGNTLIANTFNIGDNRFAQVMFSDRFGAGNYDLGVRILDTLGNVIKHKYFGTTDSELSQSSVTLLTESFSEYVSGGRIIIGGNKNGETPFYCCVDTSLTLLWSKYHSTSTAPFNASMDFVQIDDSTGVIIAEWWQTRSLAARNYINLNTGNIINTTDNVYFISASSQEQPTDITKTSAGGYLVLTLYTFSGNRYWVVTKYDAAHNVVWNNRSAALTGVYIPWDIEELADGTILVSGTVPSGPDVLPLITKLDANGTLIWEKSISAPAGYTYPTSPVGKGYEMTTILSDDRMGIVLSNNVLETASSTGKGMVTRLDSSAAVVWATIINEGEENLLMTQNNLKEFSDGYGVNGTIQQTSGGGYAGFTNLLNKATGAASCEDVIVDPSSFTVTTLASSPRVAFTFNTTSTAFTDLTMSSGDVSPSVVSCSGCVEICDNGIDDDGDGLIDCLDPDCGGVGTSSLIIVSNTNDSGAGSLRAAIDSANTRAGLDTIIFNIPTTDNGYVGYENDGMTDTLSADSVKMWSNINTPDADYGIGWWRIQPATALPDFTDPVYLDGITGNCGAACPDTFKIEINGTLFAGNNNSTLLSFAAGSDGSSISGLVINENNAPNSSGVYIDGADDFDVFCNRIGTDVTGTAPTLLTQYYGIYNAGGSSGHRIGGTTRDSMNLVSGNTSGFYALAGSDSMVFVGNYFGTVADGSAAYPANGVADHGIHFRSSNQDIKIGGALPGERNLISGNGVNGIYLQSSGDRPIIQGNLVGTDVTGMNAVGNGGNGINLRLVTDAYIGGYTAAERNVVSGNFNHGISTYRGENHTIVGNFTGINILGNAAIANTVTGILCDEVIKRVLITQNITSGNVKDGINVTARSLVSDGIHDSLFIVNNLIGTDSSGFSAVPNERGIVTFTQSVDTAVFIIENNVVSGQISHAMELTDGSATSYSYHFVKSNIIGLSIDLANNLGNGGRGIYTRNLTDYVQIGGPLVSDRNYIAGSTAEGVHGTSADGFLIQNNYIGTDGTGNAAVPNGIGVSIDDGTTAFVLDNIISGNLDYGIYVLNTVSDTLVIDDNKVGVSASGGILGNGSRGSGSLLDGIFIANVGNVADYFMVGDSTGTGNEIAYNGNNGIRVTGNSFNVSILGNSIYDNTSLGIDLDKNNSLVDANDANDADSGANNYLNFPEINRAALSGGDLMIDFNLDIPLGNYRVEIFNNPTVGIDASMHGEGEVFLGFINIAHGGTGSENFVKTFTPAAAVSLGDSITMTTTELGSFLSTSEFSGFAEVVLPLEICDNGIDDDGDGLADCGDSDCSCPPLCMLSVTSPTSGSMPAGAFDIVGTATPNNSVLVHLNDILIGTATADGAGDWTYTVDAATAATYCGTAEIKVEEYDFIALKMTDDDSATSAGAEWSDDMSAYYYLTYNVAGYPQAIGSGPDNTHDDYTTTLGVATPNANQYSGGFNYSEDGTKFYHMVSTVSSTNTRIYRFNTVDFSMDGYWDLDAAYFGADLHIKNGTLYFGSLVSSDIMSFPETTPLTSAGGGIVTPNTATIAGGVQTTFTRIFDDGANDIVLTCHNSSNIIRVANALTGATVSTLTVPNVVGFGWMGGAIDPSSGYLWIGTSHTAGSYGFVVLDISDLSNLSIVYNSAATNAVGPFADWTICGFTLGVETCFPPRTDIAIMPSMNLVGNGIQTYVVDKTTYAVITSVPSGLPATTIGGSYTPDGRWVLYNNGQVYDLDELASGTVSLEHTVMNAAPAPGTTDFYQYSARFLCSDTVNVDLCTVEVCDNGIDDDGDGLIDCFDCDDCAGSVDCPDNYACTDVNCFLETTGYSDFGIQLAESSTAGDYLAYQTVLTADIDGDDTIEVIAARDLQQIDVLSGKNINTIEHAITSGGAWEMAVGVGNQTGSNMAVAQLDGTGYLEIIFIGYPTVSPYPPRLFVLSYNGTSWDLDWSTAALDYNNPGNIISGTVGVADFDFDGQPEVYVGDNIFDVSGIGGCGNCITQMISVQSTAPGGVHKGTNYELGSDQRTLAPAVYDLLSASDCGGDPECNGLELIAGGQVYSVDINAGTATVRADLAGFGGSDTYHDGPTTIADMNLDGSPDIVVSGGFITGTGYNKGTYIWNKDTGLLGRWAYPGQSTTGNQHIFYSLPTVGNVYNDDLADDGMVNGSVVDYPEIIGTSGDGGSSSMGWLTAVNLHNTSSDVDYVWNLATNDASGATTPTIFDFNGDGILEIVYGDEVNLRLLYGGPIPFPAGVDANRNWAIFACSSGTVMEYPVIANIDGDNEVEILKVCGTSSFANVGHVQVFESDTSTSWIDGRTIWNQGFYNPLNVSEAGIIYPYSQNKILELPAGSGNYPYNRSNYQLPLMNNGVLVTPLPDISVMVLSTDNTNCAAGNLDITVQLDNMGDAVYPMGTPIAVYDGDPEAAGATLLSTSASNQTDIAIDSSENIVISLTGVTFPVTLYVVANDTGAVTLPYDLSNDFPLTSVLECDYTNNKAATAVINCVEICDNGIDDDGDGLADCGDSDCTCPSLCNLTISSPSASDKLPKDSFSIIGMATPNNSVIIFVNDTLIGTATADGAGNWSYLVDSTTAVSYCGTANISAREHDFIALKFVDDDSPTSAGAEYSDDMAGYYYLTYNALGYPQAIGSGPDNFHDDFTTTLGITPPNTDSYSGGNNYSEDGTKFYQLVSTIGSTNTRVYRFNTADLAMDGYWDLDAAYFGGDIHVKDDTIYMGSLASSEIISFPTSDTLTSVSGNIIIPNKATVPGSAQTTFTRIVNDGVKNVVITTHFSNDTIRIANPITGAIVSILKIPNVNGFGWMGGSIDPSSGYIWFGTQHTAGGFGFVVVNISDLNNPSIVYNTAASAGVVGPFLDWTICGFTGGMETTFPPRTDIAIMPSMNLNGNGTQTYVVDKATYAVLDTIPSGLPATTIAASYTPDGTWAVYTNGQVYNLDSLAAGTISLVHTISPPATAVPGTTEFYFYQSRLLCEKNVSVELCINTNSPPVATDDMPSTNEDTPLIVNVLNNDTDPDGDLLGDSVRVLTNPKNGMVADNGDSTLTYTPTANFNGLDSIQYEVCDTSALGSLCDTAWVYITVTPINDPPLIVQPPVTLPEDSMLTFCPTISDPDTGDTLTVSICEMPLNGTASSNDTCITYTPSTNFNGQDTICVVVCDAGGLCDSIDVPITVTPVNDRPVATDDMPSTNEDTPLIVNVLNNDTDPDGNLLGDSVRVLTNPKNGMVVDNGDSTLTYTPTANFNGLDSIQYEVCDTSALGSLCDTAWVYITVTPVNDPPLIVQPPVTLPEDSMLTFCPTISDPDTGNTLTVSICEMPLNGTASSNDTCITYTPSANFNGMDTVCVVVCDAGGLCDSIDIPIMVTPKNDTPLIVQPPVTLPEDSMLTFCPTISDPDTGDTLTVSICEMPLNGTASSNDTCITYTPSANFNGMDTVCVVVCDAGGLCDSIDVPITVTPVNDKPLAVDDALTLNEDTSNVVIDVQNNDSDPENDPLTTSIVTPPTSGGTATPNGTGGITYTPPSDFNGPDTLTYKVCDSGGLCDTAQVILNITPVNDPPVATDDMPSTNEDTPLIVNVLSNDTDPDGNLLRDSVRVLTTPKNGMVVDNGDSTLTYTPTANFNGLDSIQYEVCDTSALGSLCDTAWVYITVTPVNDPPLIVQPPVTLPEDSMLTFCPTISDPDTGDTLTVSICEMPLNGTASSNDTCITYTPNANFNGQDTICVVVCDAGGLCDSIDVPITVTPKNDPPLIVQPPVTLPEDSMLTFCPTISDPDTGDTLTVSICKMPLNGTASSNDTCITYTPSANFNGMDTVCVVVCDAGGLCDSIEVPITITPVNDAPMAVDDALTVNEDTSNVVIDVQNNDSDPENDPLTTSIVTPPTSGGTAAPNGTGGITYTPPSDFNGPDTLTYKVCDSGGLCDTAQVILNITPVNDPPVATDDMPSTSEDTPLIVNVLNNDTDPDGNLLGDSVRVLTNPKNGSVADNGDSTLTYTPTANFNGLDSIQYEVCDTSALGSLCDTAWVYITVTPVNDPPLIVQPPVTLPEDSMLTFCPTISDPDTGDTLTVSICEMPLNGTASSNDTCITYTPNANFNGQDTICVVVCDAGGLCDSIEVPITITPVNDAPMAVDDALTLNEDTSNVVIDVQNNDSDPENDPLTTSIVTPPTSGGTAAPNGTGGITYTPPSDFNGPDTLTYKVCDSGGLCDTAQVILNITPVNDPPVATDDMPSTSEDTPLIVNVLNNDTDPDGNLLGDSVRVLTNPKNGSVVDNGDSTLTYTPTANFNGLDSIQYEVCDTSVLGSLCDTAWVYITVNPVNDPPLQGNETVFTPTDSLLMDIDLDSNNTDPDGDLLTVTPPAMSIQGGTITNNGDGTIDYQPPMGYIGQDTVIYTVCDPTPACVTDTLFIKVGACVEIIAHVWLEGAYEGDAMYTKLNDLGYLPGQKPSTFFGTATSAGQPYAVAPWLYMGAEGVAYDQDSTGTDDAGYPATVVDWVLVSLRTGTDRATTICTQAALLHSDGHIEMVEEFGCCNINPDSSYYLVIEHRNHLLVMSHQKLAITNDTLTYDFRSQQSYIALLGFGQKQIKPGVFVMFAGNGQQITVGASDTDINVGDKDAWLDKNGEHSSYRFQDFDMNGDVNVQDKNLWLRNNGKFSDVPRE